MTDYAVQDEHNLRLYDTALDMAAINKALVVQDVAAVSYTHLEPEAPEQGQVSELWRVAERPERAAFLSGQAAPCH